MVYKNCQYPWDIPSAQGIGQTTFLAFSLNELLSMHNISAFLACLIRIAWGLLIHKFPDPTWINWARIVKDSQSLVGRGKTWWSSDKLRTQVLRCDLCITLAATVCWGKSTSTAWQYYTESYLNSPGHPFTHITEVQTMCWKTQRHIN